MSVPSQNRTTVENMYKAAARGDIAGFLSYFTEDLRVIEPPFLPYGGTHRGIAGFQALFGQIAKFIDVSSLKIESIIAEGEVVTAFLRLNSAAGDGEVQIAERAVLRNGKIVEMKIYIHEFASVLSG